MNPLERLEHVKLEWKEDAEINREKITEEIGRTPILLHKWLDIFTSTKIEARKEQEKMMKLLRLKQRYYNGELDKQTLIDLGWKQYQGNKPLKTEMDKLLKQDQMVVEQETVIETYNIIIEYIEMVLGYIKYRDTSCKTIFESIRFYAGG